MTQTQAIRSDEQQTQTQRRESSTTELLDQTKRILEIKEKVMRENVHYGVIPGCKKPSLWKPGAEKLCTAFRLSPEFKTTGREDPERTIKWERRPDNGKAIEGLTKGYFEYDSACTLVHIPTGEVWARDVRGSCNNFEAKYRSLIGYEVKNTLEKMSEKRSLVAAVLIGTAASDIFTQDIEDIPSDLISPENGTPPTTDEGGHTPNHEDKDGGNGGGDGGENFRRATKKQVSYIQDQIKKKNITDKTFFEVWGVEDFEGVPFSQVNRILAWIREQK